MNRQIVTIGFVVSVLVLGVSLTQTGGSTLPSCTNEFTPCATKMDSNFEYKKQCLCPNTACPMENDYTLNRTVVLVHKLKTSIQTRKYYFCDDALFKYKKNSSGDSGIALVQNYHTLQATMLTAYRRCYEDTYYHKETKTNSTSQISVITYQCRKDEATIPKCNDELLPCGRTQDSTNYKTLCTCANTRCPRGNDHTNRTVVLVENLLSKNPRVHMDHFCTNTVLKDKKPSPTDAGVALNQEFTQVKGHKDKRLVMTTVKHRCPEDKYYLIETKNGPAKSTVSKSYRCNKQPKCTNELLPCGQTHNGKNYEKLCSCANAICSTDGSYVRNRTIVLINGQTRVKNPRTRMYHFCDDTLLNNQPFSPTKDGVALALVFNVRPTGRKDEISLLSTTVNHRCQDDIYFLNNVIYDKSDAQKSSFYKCTDPSAPPKCTDNKHFACSRTWYSENHKEICSCPKTTCPSSNDIVKDRTIILIDDAKNPKMRNRTYHFCTDALLKNKPLSSSSHPFAVVQEFTSQHIGLKPEKSLLTKTTVNHRCLNAKYYLTESRYNPVTETASRFYQCTQQHECKPAENCIDTTRGNYKGTHYIMKDKMNCICPKSDQCIGSTNNGFLCIKLLS